MDTIYSNHIDRKNDDRNIHVFSETLHILSRTFNSMIFRSSIDGIIHFVSSNIKKFLGYDADDFVGRKLSDFLHEKDKSKFLNSFCLLSQDDNDDSSLTLRVKKRDGLFLWMDLKMKMLKDLHQRPVEYIYIIQEIPVDNDENLLENDKLSLIGQLAAGIAHEIRNPLTSIKGFIQLMKSDDKKRDEYLEIMENEIDRIDSISNELMIFAKPNHSKYKYHNLKDIFKTCVTLLEGLAFQKQIKMVLDYDDEPVCVYCDEQKIKQVIINIVKNAIEAMDEPGKIYIQIGKNGDKGILSIRDEGCGIPPDLIDKIGQPFFTTKQNGNGLGLMMCYKIIEEHKGKIDVQSELGVGTTFRIFLPLDHVE